MLLTDHQLDAAAALRGGRLGRMQLRIHVAAANGELVELPFGKTTVGSGPRCQVRIQQAGVQPLHCLIVNEADGVTVRRWAPNTLLNGAPFDEAPLAAGDVLSLGPVDVEVIGASLTDIFHASDDRAAIEETSDDRFELIASEEAGVSSAELPAEDVTHTWDNTTVHHSTVWVGKAPSVAEATEKIAPHAIEQAERPIGPAAAANSIEAAAPSEVVAAEGAREVFRQMQDANTVSRARCRKLLQALRTKRDALRATELRVGELEQQIEIMSRDDASTEYVVRGPSKESMDWHVAEVARLTSELQLRMRRIEELEGQLALAGTTAVAAEPASDAGLPETTFESPALEEHCAEQWPGLHGAATEPFLTSAAVGQISAAEPCGETTVDLTSRPSGGESEPNRDRPTTDPSEGEESIEQYMAKLLQRVRGESSSAIVPAPQPASEPQLVTPNAPTESAKPTAEAEEAKRDVTPLTDLSQMVRSERAPESPTNLDALRAVANASARQAIGVHTSKTHRRDAVTKFIVASLAGMTSIWLMMLAPTWRDWQFITACVGWMIAAYWAGQTYGKLVEYARAGDYDGRDEDFNANDEPRLAGRFPVHADKAGGSYPEKVKR